MKGKYLMLVPETTDGFRATVGSLSSIGVGKGVSFHTVCLSEDRCIGVKEPRQVHARARDWREMEAMHNQVAAAEQDARKDRPLTPGTQGGKSSFTHRNLPSAD